MKTYTIIAGVNGTGKSSLTGVLRAERSDLGYVVDVDKIAAEGGFGAVMAGRVAILKIDELLSMGASLTQETTLSGRRTENTVKLARDLGYRVRLFYIGLNTCEESLKRIKNRVEKGGHDIPAQTVVNRFSKRFEPLRKILPLCDEAYLFDNENGFSEVARYKNGEMVLVCQNKPQWLSELMKKLLQ